jgi:hypothetical protein
VNTTDPNGTDVNAMKAGNVNKVNQTVVDNAQAAYYANTTTVL